MASQEPVPTVQEGNKEEQYRKLLADLAKARQDPLFQSLVNPRVEGPVLPLERDRSVEGRGTRNRERSHHTQSRRSSSSRHESSRRSWHIILTEEQDATDNAAGGTWRKEVSLLSLLHLMDTMPSQRRLCSLSDNLMRPLAWKTFMSPQN